jgi:hypothetical protein
MPDRIAELERVAKLLKGEDIITSSVDPEQYKDILAEEGG